MEDQTNGWPGMSAEEVGYVLARHVLDVVRLTREHRPGLSMDELEGLLLLALAQADDACRSAGVSPERLQ